MRNGGKRTVCGLGGVKRKSHQMTGKRQKPGEGPWRHKGEALQASEGSRLMRRGSSRRRSGHAKRATVLSGGSSVRWTVKVQPTRRAMSRTCAALLLELRLIGIAQTFRLAGEISERVRPSPRTRRGLNRARSLPPDRQICTIWPATPSAAIAPRECGDAIWLFEEISEHQHGRKSRQFHGARKNVGLWGCNQCLCHAHQGRTRNGAGTKFVPKSRDTLMGADGEARDRKCEKLGALALARRWQDGTERSSKWRATPTATMYLPPPIHSRG